MDKYGKSPYSVLNSINTNCKYIKPGMITTQGYKSKYESKNRDLIALPKYTETDTRDMVVNSKFDKNRNEASMGKWKVDTEASQELELDLGDELFTKTFDGT